MENEPILPGLDGFVYDPENVAQPEAPIEPEAPDETSLLEQAISGLGEGALTMLGAPIDFANWSNDLMVQGINKLTGSSMPTSAEIREQNDVGNPGSGEAYTGAAKDLGIISETGPQTRGQRFARRTGQELGAGVVMAPLGLINAGGKAASILFTDLAADLGSGTAAQAAIEYFPDSVVAELAASFLGAAGGATLAQNAVRAPQRLAYKKAVDRGLRETPNVFQLKNEAKRLYGVAESTGLSATKEQVSGFYDNLIAIADNEGLIIGGKVSTPDMPRIKQGFRLAAEYADETLTPKNMMKIRRNFQRVAASTDPAEARIGLQMLKSYDAFTSPLLPELAEANRLYAASMRGKLIEQTVLKAQIGAKKSRTLGFDDEIRKRFSKLAMDIVDEKKGVSNLNAMQKRVINKLAEGGPLENLLTKLGKMAPTGAISAGVTSSPLQTGAIMGSIQGSALPAAIGAGITAGSAITGVVGRAGVNALQRRNAKIASAVMRGMSLPDQVLSPSAFDQVFSTWLIQNAGKISGKEE